MVGSLGADALGDQAIERLRKENIDCQHVMRDSEMLPECANQCRQTGRESNCCRARQTQHSPLNI